jgi:hypothetical protein
LARCIFDFSPTCRAARRALALADPLAPARVALAAADEASVEAGVTAASPFFDENFSSAAGNAAATGIAGG